MDYAVSTSLQTVFKRHTALSPLATSLLCLLTSACSSVSNVSVDFHPQIMTNGVDMRQYDKDRSACERDTLDHPSKMESNMHVRFRKCLIDKGYVLLS